LTIGGKALKVKPYKRDALQDIVSISERKPLLYGRC
jgi:hypothetical protein